MKAAIIILSVVVVGLLSQTRVIRWHG